MGLRFVPFPGPSSSGDQVFGERGRCDSSPPPSPPLGFLGVHLAHLLRRTSTVQNPEKPWLATKPACSLVDDASLGPRLPPFGFGCPLLPVTGGGWSAAGQLCSVLCSVSRPDGVFSSVQFSRSVMSDSLRPHGLQPGRLLHPGGFPGKNTGVSCHAVS